MLNAAGIDSTAFDAKAYYEQLITTSSLPTLLRKENELLNGAHALAQVRASRHALSLL